MEEFCLIVTLSQPFNVGFLPPKDLFLELNLQELVASALFKANRLEAVGLSSYAACANRTSSSALATFCMTLPKVSRF